MNTTIGRGDRDPIPGKWGQLIDRLDRSKFNNHPLTKKVAEIVMLPTTMMAQGFDSLMQRLDSALSSGKDQEVTKTMGDIVKSAEKK